jgi:hypothetical protein
MATGRHRLNEASVANATLFTADAGGTLALYNNSGVTLTGVSSSPSPVEGSRSMQLTYPSGFDGSYISNGLGSVGWVDYFLYIPTAATSTYVFVDMIQHDFGGDFFLTWASIHDNGSTHLEFYYFGVDGEFYVDRASTPAGTVPKNEWVRVRANSTFADGVVQIDVFKGADLYKTTPDSSLNNYGVYGFFSNALSRGIWRNGGNTNTYYIDDYLQNDTTTPPVRTAPTSLTAYGPSIRR